MPFWGHLYAQNTIMYRQAKDPIEWNFPVEVTRVFRLKLRQLMEDLEKRDVLGRRVAKTHVVEW